VGTDCFGSHVASFFFFHKEKILLYCVEHSTVPLYVSASHTEQRYKRSTVTLGCIAQETVAVLLFSASHTEQKMVCAVLES
jgi:hypothetical protein